IVDTDYGGTHAGILARELDDVASGDAGPLRDFFGRILLRARFQVFETHRVAGNVVGVVEIFVDDDVHQAERQRGIGAGIDRQVPVGALGRARAIGIDNHQLRAFAASLFDKRPEMDVVAMNVRCPGNDVARVRELLRLGAELDANHRFQALFAGAGANAALQLRGAQAMEETPIHGSAVERAQCASVGVGQDGFAAVLGNGPAQAMGDFVEGLVPGNAPKRTLWSGGRPRPSFPQRSAPFRFRSYHRIKHALRRVHAVQILGDFRTQESARDRVFAIALNLRGPSVFDGDQHAAGIRAIVRAGGMDDALHSSDYKVKRVNH